MLNLTFSKSNNSFSKRRRMVITRNDWTINGKVINVKEVKNGFWLKVKTDAKLSQLYSIDKLEFDCFLRNAIAQTAYKKNSYFTKLHATGKFIFEKNECYFLVEQLLV